MRYAELFEDTNKDLERSRRVHHATQNFMRYAYDRGEADLETVIEGKTWHGYDVKNFGGAEVYGVDDLVILVGRRRRHGSGATYTLFQEPWHGFKYLLMLEIVPGELTDQNVKGFINTVDAMNIIKHEFVHFFDDMETGGKTIATHPYKIDTEAKKLDPKTTQIDMNDYYNNPWEFNAYYHMVADNFLRIIHEIETGEPSWVNDILDLYDFTGTFSKDLERSVRGVKVGHKFMAALTEPRRRSLLRRLYQLHKRVLDAAAAARAAGTRKQAA